MSDGATLYVKLLGADQPDGGKSKPLLIALHGGPGWSSHAETEISFGWLSDRFRVLVYDARGSGESDCIAPYTHERWAQDIDELRLELSVSQ